MEFTNLSISLVFVFIYSIRALTSFDNGRYERVLYIEWAHDNIFDYADFPNWDSSFFLNNIVDNFDPPLTAVSPVFYNVVNPRNNPDYNRIINGLNSRGISIWPTVGNAPGSGQQVSGGPQGGFAINSTTAKTIASYYKNFTDTIRIDNCQLYYTQSQSNLTDMFDWLIHNQSFNHIQLDSWPVDRGKFANYTKEQYPQIDATGFQAYLDYNPDTYKINASNPNNWLPHTNEIDGVHTLRPDVYIRMGYENPGAARAIANLTLDQAEAGFNTTINAIKVYNEHKFNNGSLRWAAPFNPNYNPIKLNTFLWIRQQIENETDL